MVRKWMCFQGKRGKVNYEATAIEEILPVELPSYDERKETPEGSSIENKSDHPILTAIDGDWLIFLRKQTVLREVTGECRDLASNKVVRFEVERK